MTKTYYILNIHHLVEVGIKLVDRWFRGHSRVHNELTPGIFRNNEEFLIFPPKDIDDDIEFLLTEEFRRYAPTATREIPERNDFLSWLVLMQHYRMPTRLLDWTENPLIAAYFAVSDDQYVDGELWAMVPFALNKSHSIEELYGTAIVEHPIVKYLATQPMFSGNEEVLADHSGLEKIPLYPVAIQYPMVFPRMSSQSSTFTIHPKPRKGCSIPEILIDEADLVRYIIPAECKRAILSDLRSLGINWRMIFQDLEYISKDLKYRYEEGIVDNCAYTKQGQIDPPHCGGIYLG